MDHWLLVLQDSWWVFRWVLAPLTFVGAGICLGESDEPTFVPFFFIAIGSLFYGAAKETRICGGGGVSEDYTYADNLYICV